MSTECFGCRDLVPDSDLTVLETNHEKILVCPRCVFILALYIENGIKKYWHKGDLHPDFLNARYKKILTEEFYPHPKETYQKYLPNMIAEEERSRNIIHVEEKVINNLNDFPFVMFDIPESKQYQLTPGNEVTLMCGEHTITRKIYSAVPIAGKYLKQYGKTKKQLVVFIPEED